MYVLGSLGSLEPLRFLECLGTFGPSGLEVPGSSGILGSLGAGRLGLGHVLVLGSFAWTPGTDWTTWTTRTLEHIWILGIL